MNNGQMDRGNENPAQHLLWWLKKTTEKTPVRLVGTGIWTRDLPNASLVRYHGATSLGTIIVDKFTYTDLEYLFLSESDGLILGDNTPGIP